MSFEEEWALHKAKALEGQSGTRLNSAGGGGAPGGGKKLRVTASVLRERARRSENRVAKDFKDAQRSAARKAGAVPGSMKGFGCDEAVEDYMKAWRAKVEYVTGLLGAEGVAGSLRAAADEFDTGDEDEGARQRRHGSGASDGRSGGGDGGSPVKPAKPYKPGDIV